MRNYFTSLHFPYGCICRTAMAFGFPVSSRLSRFAYSLG